MKKFLMLLVICSLTSLAGAAVDVWLTNGQGQSTITLQPSQTVTLQLWYSGDSVISFDSDIDAMGPGTLLLETAAIAATNRNTEYDFIWIPGMNEGAELEMTGSADALALGAGMLNPWATINFHCDGAGDVTINPILVSLFDLEWNDILGNAVTHGMTIHQEIPEPASMILLAIGGLLLKRKK